jgi:hypothetical protein
LQLLEETTSVDLRIKEALLQRLSFRGALLRTVATVDDRTSPVLLSSVWSATLQLLPGIKSEREMAKPVPESFSVKLQRKLASTVPPRPVVSVAFEDAYEHLERVCKDGLLVTEVLDFHDSHSLMVILSLSASL